MLLPADGQALPSIAFEWPLCDFEHRKLFYRLRSSFAVSVVGCLSKFWLNNLERAKIFNRERLMTEVYGNFRKRPLLTVSNHISCFDEPTMWGMLDWKLFFKPNMMRWSIAAHDVCFTTRANSLLFSSGKCIPIVRGYGVYQKAMDFTVKRLSNNEWVHIFPEGKVNVTEEWLRLKWGIGRLIAEPPICPLVLPIWLVGFDDILPNTEPLEKRPRLFQDVTLVVGRPMELTEFRKDLLEQNLGAKVTRKVLTDKVEDELKELRRLALDLHGGVAGAEEEFKVYLGEAR